MMAEQTPLKSFFYGESGWRNIFPLNYFPEGKADGVDSSLAANVFPLKRLSPPMAMADGALSAIPPRKRFNAIPFPVRRLTDGDIETQRSKGAKKR